MNTQNAFWSTSLGGVLSAFLVVIGILVVIFAIVSVIKHVAKGEVGKAVKAVIFSIILAAFLFQPQLATTAINVGGTVVSKVLDTVGGLAGGNSTPTGTTPPTTPGG